MNQRMANEENITEQWELGDEGQTPVPVADKKSFLEEFLIPDRKDWEFAKDAGRFWGAVPTETTGIVKNFLDRGQGSLLPGIYNFYQSTFGKGKEGEITVPWEKIQGDEKLSTYLDNMKEVHLRNNADEIKNQEDLWHDHFYAMLEKYNIDESDENAGDKLRQSMYAKENYEGGGKEDAQKLLDIQSSYILAKNPYIINDENQDDIPESITFKDELFSNTPMEPDVKFIDENTISFPYLGDIKFNENEEGDFTMQHPSVLKPLDQPGVKNYLDKVPAGDALQKWQEFVTPEYSPEPDLFRKPGWVMGGMGPAMLSAVGPLAWKGAKWAAPKVSRFNPYVAGIMTALQAGKAEAPTLVPEGQEIPTAPEGMIWDGTKLVEAQ